MSEEFRISMLLSSPEMRSDSQNNMVPIIDIIPVPGKDDYVLLVMPYLRVFDTPRFHCKAEIVEAIRQFLQVRVSSFCPGSLLITVL
jgi:hypothetical protein